MWKEKAACLHEHQMHDHKYLHHIALHVICLCGMYLFANYAGILYPYLLSRQEKLIPCLWRPTLHEEILIALWACAVYLSHRPIPLARERASARRRILRWSPLIRWPERSCHPQANRTLFHAAIDRGRAKPPESSQIDRSKEGWAKRSARSRCCV